MKIYHKNILAYPLALSFLPILPQASVATVCNLGRECVISLTADTTAEAKNDDSVLHYTNDVEITTQTGYKAAIRAASIRGGVIFDKNVTLNTNEPIRTVTLVDVSAGSKVSIGGDLKLDVQIMENNPLIDVRGDGSQLNITGNLDFSLQELAPGVSSKTGQAILVRDGGVLKVTGHSNIDVTNQIANRSGLNVNRHGEASFETLDIKSKDGRAVQVGWDGFVTSTEQTNIVSVNDTAMWIDGNSFISIGEEESVTQHLKTQSTSVGIINIGSKAIVDGGDIGIYALDQPAINTAPKTIIIKGTVKGKNAAIWATDYDSLSDIVKVQGGTVIGDVFMRGGNDEYHIEAGSQTGIVDMGHGDDMAELSGGSIDGSIKMGEGKDKVKITGSFNADKLVQIDGGGSSNTVDKGELTIDDYSLRGYTGAIQNGKGVAIQNFNSINVVNNGELILSSKDIFGVITSSANNKNTLFIDSTSSVTNENGSPAIQNIYADVNNEGFLHMDGNKTVGDTWTIEGNYTGNNGTVIFDTKLGDDSSPTDFLHITGNSTGNSFVQVINRNGLGALTVGDGIQLIQVDGTADANNFALQSDYSFEGTPVVVGGAYVYSLHAGNKAGIFDGDWYLRSQLSNPGTKEPPVYQPGVPLYEVYPQVLLQLNKLGTLEQRVGNRVWMGTADPKPFKKGVLSSEEPADIIEGRGFWMKVEGSTSHINPAVSTSKSHYDLDIIKTQFGLDFVASENDKGKLIGGVYFQYGHAKADISSRFGKGDIKTNGYGVGGTLTWYGTNDVYVDGVAHVMWYKSDIRSDWLKNHNLVNGNDGIGYAVSIETGKKIQLNHEWTMTPQAQLSYNAINFDSFNDAYNAHVSREDGDALTGRLGIAFNREKAWLSDSGDTRRLKNYGIGNIYYEFLDGTNVSVTNVDFHNRSDRLWGGLGTGLSYNWKDDAYSIYGEVDARTSLSNFADSYSFNGTVGFRAKF